MKGAHSVGNGGEGAHVIWRQLEVQGLQVGLDVLRLDCFECGADASLQLPAQQHLQPPRRFRSCCAIVSKDYAPCQL